MHELSTNISHFLLFVFVCTILPCPLVGKGWMKQNTASAISTLSLSLSLSLSCKTMIVGGRPKEDILGFRENICLLCRLQCQDTNNQELTAHAVPVVCLLTGRVIIGRRGSGPARRARRPASIS